jgi:hypothetical protein
MLLVLSVGQHSDRVDYQSLFILHLIEVVWVAFRFVLRKVGTLALFAAVFDILAAGTRCKIDCGFVFRTVLLVTPRTGIADGFAIDN